jgi:hypothetical protein
LKWPSSEGGEPAAIHSAGLITNSVRFPRLVAGIFYQANCFVRQYTTTAQVEQWHSTLLTWKQPLVLRHRARLNQASQAQTKSEPPSESELWMKLQSQLKLVEESVKLWMTKM